MEYHARGYYDHYGLWGIYTTPRNIGRYVMDELGGRDLILNSDPSLATLGKYWKGYPVDGQPLSSLKSLIIPTYIHDTWVGRAMVYPFYYDILGEDADYAWIESHYLCFESPSGVIKEYEPFPGQIFEFTPDEVGTWKVFLSALDASKRIANTTTYFNVLPACGQSSTFSNMYNGFVYYDVAGVLRSETRISKIEIVDNAVSPAKVNFEYPGFRSRDDLATFKIVTVPLPPRDRMDMVGFGSRLVYLNTNSQVFPSGPLQVTKVGLTINDEPMPVTLEVKAPLPF